MVEPVAGEADGAQLVVGAAVARGSAVVPVEEVEGVLMERTLPRGSDATARTLDAAATARRVAEDAVPTTASSGPRRRARAKRGPTTSTSATWPRKSAGSSPSQSPSCRSTTCSV